MTYTKKQFLEDVKKEAVALKKHATKEELGNLKIRQLNPHSVSDCVYGLMTGYCRSSRAVYLMDKCCARFAYLDALTTMKEIDDADDAMFVVSENINGKKSDLPLTIKYVSALETYIATPFAKNKNLIDFLKGNRKDLVL